MHHQTFIFVELKDDSVKFDYSGRVGHPFLLVEWGKDEEDQGRLYIHSKVIKECQDQDHKKPKESKGWQVDQAHVKSTESPQVRMKYHNCNVDLPVLIGNGECNDGAYNTIECLFDAGDCEEINKYPNCTVDEIDWIGDGYRDGRAYNLQYY